MAVKADVREVKSKKNKNKAVKKKTFVCEGSYVDIDGVAHRYHKRGFNTADEAKDWERSFLLKSRTSVNSDMTFDDLFILFLTTKKNVVKDRTYTELQATYKKYIRPFWGNKKLSDIKPMHITNYQSSLIEMKSNKDTFYSNATIVTIQIRLKSLLRYAFDDGYVSNPKIVSFKTVRRSDETIKEMNFWHPNEFNKFMSVVDEDVYIALFSVLYWCGLRIGEALALQWSDIDFKSKSIQISKTYAKHKRQTTTPKTKNSYRTVIMPDECFNSVCSLYESHKHIAGYDDNKLLFNFEKPLDDNSIRIKKDRWIEEAGVKRIRIHDFRHSHVSLLVSLGFNPFDIAKRLGHSVEMVNEVYGHWFDDAQKKMVDALNNV